MFEILSVVMFASQVACMSHIPPPPPDSTVVKFEDGELVENSSAHLIIKCDEFGTRRIWIEKVQTEAEALMGQYPTNKRRKQK